MAKTSVNEVATVQEAGAKGGKARAKNLSAEEREGIARRAAEARWANAESSGADAVVAPYNGVIRIGNLEIQCSVLQDGTRVLSERGVMKALGVARSGTAHNRGKQESAEGGAALPLFVASSNLKPFVDLELASVLQKPIWYRPASGESAGRLHKGVRADLLPKICNVWLKARDAGVIRGARQALVVVNADILLRGLADVGIAGLVDEATGFQDVRARDALAKILEKFVAKEIQNYVKLFPLDYFRELCKLRGVPFVENLQLPRYFGHLTNDIIYARLAPAVLEELRRKNPVVDGRRKGKHYNWLTPTIGNPKLLQHLGSVLTLMKLSDNYEMFKVMLDRIHPVYQELPLFLWAETEN